MVETPIVTEAEDDAVTDGEFVGDDVGVPEDDGETDGVCVDER